jgi:hypothetical protein
MAVYNGERELLATPIVTMIVYVFSVALDGLFG